MNKPTRTLEQGVVCIILADVRVCTRPGHHKKLTNQRHAYTDLHTSRYWTKQTTILNLQIMYVHRATDFNPPPSFLRWTVINFYTCCAMDNVRVSTYLYVYGVCRVWISL